MNCQELRERIVDPASSTQGGHAPVVEHLQTCAPCRALAREFAAIERLVQAAPEAEPPADFDERVRARMARETAGTRTLSLLLSRRTLGAAVVVIGLGVAGLLIRKSPAPPPAGVAPSPKVAAAPTPAPREPPPPDILAVRSTPITLETGPVGEEERQRILSLHGLEFLGFVETLARLSPLFPAEIGPALPGTASAPPAGERDEAEASRLADWRAVSPTERERWLKLEAAYAARPFTTRQTLEERWRRVRTFTPDELAGLKRLAGRFSEMDAKLLSRLESEIRAIARLGAQERRFRWRTHPFVRTLTGQEIASGEKLLLST